MPPISSSPSPGATPPVVLVSMPFAGFRQPSLALGLLAAALRPVGVPVRTLHASLWFAELIGPRLYDLIATWRVEDMLGDWFFAHQLETAPAQPAQEYFDAVLAGGSPEHCVPYFGKPPLDHGLRDELRAARERTDEILTRCLEEITALSPVVLGFTSMVHQQTASLALAERAKAALPGTLIVFGGPACHGEMGAQLLRSFRCVDAVATGEGELVLPELVRRRLAGEPVVSGAGLLARADGARATEAASARATGAARPAEPAAKAAEAAEPAPLPPLDLDMSPVPDFADYFAQLEGSPLESIFVPRLPLETSRGCWWGERCRCAFCGQASGALAYRAKSAERALRDLRELTQRHPSHPVVITDEILPPGYFDELLPRLPQAVPDLQVIYLQVRPDISRPQLAALAAAGIRRVEVGIESLSTPVLRLMRKGTTMLANVQFLKWAREMGVEVVWNVLWGLPGESSAEYQRMADLVPLLTHLQPPNTVGAFRLDRFSPVFDDPDSSGIDDVRPYPASSFVYSLPENERARLVASFAFSYRSAQPVHIYTLPLAMRIADWKEQAGTSKLAFAVESERLVIFEDRPGFDHDEVTVLDGDHRELYQACTSIRSAPELARDLSARRRQIAGAPGDGTITEADVHELLAPLVDQGLMLREGQRYLSLALPLPRV